MTERNSGKKHGKKKKREENLKKKKKNILLSKRLCVDQSTLHGFRPSWKENSPEVGRQKTCFKVAIEQQGRGEEGGRLALCAFYPRRIGHALNTIYTDPEPRGNFLLLFN